MVGKAGRSGGNHMPQKLMPSSFEPPTKPSGLSKLASKKWDEVIKLLPDDYLAPIDVYELKNLVVLLCQSDALAIKLDDDSAAESTHRIYLNVLKQIHQLSASFGLNPADRERLGLNTAPLEEDPIEQFRNYINNPN